MKASVREVWPAFNAPLRAPWTGAPDPDETAAVFRQLAELETLLRGRMVRHHSGSVIMPFAAFNSWPADAQLGLLSMGWAMGPKFHFPRFQDAACTRDWLRCAATCRINPESGRMPRRNDRNQQLFRNAFRVESENLDPEALLLRVR
ncbi:hypothetical protein [Nocardia goodfellowii]|uniref:Uncharacterized protein n=1 Tax=Nocardia goodfellowii TaxID=882446 RepID=A0ABS4QIX4_9NOCA|nr:hypothetical protein [Nocardia goodfellowii]MBP2191004.1 hypothetical protein [Nocardia goodfellowii]